MNKKTVFTATLLAATMWPIGQEVSAGVNIDINIGQPAPVIIAPMPPRQAPHRIVVERRPRFMYTPSLGFYVSVDSPYDIVYYGSRYYVYDDGGWYWARSYDGPWVFVEGHRLPHRISRFRHEEIRRHRDEEFRRYPDDRDRQDRGRGRGHDRWH